MKKKTQSNFAHMKITEIIRDRKALLYSSVFLSIICIALILYILKPNEYLLLVNNGTDEVLHSIELDEGLIFSITYTHSVERSEVTEVFEVRDEEIFVMESYTESYGAGLPYEGTVLEEDGRFVIKDINQRIDSLVVRPSKLYPHYLSYNDEIIMISDYPFRGKNIRIVVNERGENFE